MLTQMSSTAPAVVVLFIYTPDIYYARRPFRWRYIRPVGRVYRVRRPGGIVRIGLPHARTHSKVDYTCFSRVRARLALIVSVFVIADDARRRLYFKL